VIRLTRLAALSIALSILFAPSTRAATPADTLADGTRIERWTLTNGLKVVTRSAPGSGAVAITLGYRMGIDDDPAGRAGLAQLLGELAFTAAAGTQPERAPGELDSQRPLGWSYPVLRHVTLLTEVASLDRFPQVLAQVAERAKGVTVDEAQLGVARARVKKELAQQLFGEPTVILNHQLREIARGRSDGEIVRHASGSEIERATVAEIQQELRAWYCPANAVLSLVGDFGAVDVHALVERQFGSIPGGAARPEPAIAPLRPATRAMRRDGAPIGTIGILAPALSDSSHPSFYMATMVLGSMCQESWNKGTQGASRYQFALVDEPELFRLFPDVPRTEGDPGRLVYTLRLVTDVLPTLVIPDDDFEQVRSSMTAILGGPMPRAQRTALATNPGLLHSLARGQAACELRMGPVFWERYRRGLEAVSPSSVSLWKDWFEAPAHQVVLLLTPNPK
jgi:predicted Zn-dependent peptidase